MNNEEQSRLKKALSGLIRQVDSGAPTYHLHDLVLSIIDSWRRERAVKAVHGVSLIVCWIVSWVALALDGKFPDKEDTLNRHCIQIIVSQP
jgi:hypothetical protein